MFNKMEQQPFVLAELEDLSSILLPLKTTSRIKYTTFNVSQNFIVFGATSGGLYVFKREPCIFLQLLPNNEGSVTQVAISPDEKLIAFSTNKGTVSVLERSAGHGAKHLLSSYEHQNTQVTSLQWSAGNDELYIGDDMGKVSILTISVFTPKNMFQTPSFPLMQLDSKIVQVDLHGDILLVSTLTRCYICDTAKELFRQIGHKLRDGEFGACIYNTDNNNYNVTSHRKTQPYESFSSVDDQNQTQDYSSLKHLKLYCARPGSRIWEVSIDGTVLSTHNFKQALAVPPTSIIFHNSHPSSQLNGDYNNFNIVNGHQCPEQSFNFHKLSTIVSNKFLFTFKKDGIYIFDPEKADVILWNNELIDIVDAKVVNDVIYVWCASGKMYALNVTALDKYLIRLYFRKKYFLVCKLCLKYIDYLTTCTKESSKLNVLSDLDEKLKQNSEVNTDVEDVEFLCRELKPLLELLTNNAQQKQMKQAQKLQSGIYLVRNNIQIDREVDKNRVARPSYLSGLTLYKDKNRAHSVSPDRYQLTTQNHGSCSSLPELMVPRNQFQEEETIISPSYPSLDLSCLQQQLQQSPSQVDLQLFLNNVIKLYYEYNDQANDSVHLLDVARPFPFVHYFDDERIQIISTLFDNCFVGNTLCQWFEQFSIPDFNVSLPSFLLNYFSLDVLQLDFKMSQLLKLFSELLDENTIVDLVYKLEMDCCYFSLCEILSYCQTQHKTHTNMSVTEVESKPKLLNFIYYLVKCNDIDKCSRYFNAVELHEVLYVILKYEHDSIKNGKSVELAELQCQTIFLSFLDKLANRDELVLNLKYELVEEYVRNAVENVNNSSSVDVSSRCVCGFPVPGLLASPPLFADLGYVLIERMWPSKQLKCFQLCGKVPYLWRYLVMHRRTESILSILTLILQLGDVEELEARSSELNTMLLEICVRHLIELKNMNCLNCGQKVKVKKQGTVTWTQLGLISVRCIGPQETQSLFSKYKSDISSQELDQTFFQSLIFSAIMEKHSKGLRKNVVDLLNGKNEQLKTQLPVFSEQLKSELLSDDCFETKKRKSKVKSSGGIEHHWGIKIDTRSCCTSCTLPLNSSALLNEGVLKIFKCQHAFHSVCLKKQDTVCPVCSK